MTTTGILSFSRATTGGKSTGNCYTNCSVSSDDAMMKVDHPDTQLTDKTANAIRDVPDLTRWPESTAHPV